MLHKKPFYNLFFFQQELQTEVNGLEDSKDELLEHSEFVLSILKGYSAQAAAETANSVQDVVDSYDK